MQHDENSESQHSGDLVEQLRRYAFAGVPLAGQHTAFYERHLKFDNVMAPTTASPREQFEAFARSIRDLLADRWLSTEETYRELDQKRVYYLSMEFLIGRQLANNVTNLLLNPRAEQILREIDVDWITLVEDEPDAGLGNGGPPQRSAARGT